MQSKALTSLDAWLAEAQRVLAEQHEHWEHETEAEVPTRGEPVQLSFDLGGL